MKLEDRDKPLFFVNLAIVALLMVVVLWRQPLIERPWVDPACGKHSLECLVYTWQTLIGSLVAVAAVFLTIREAQKQYRFSRWLQYEKLVEDYKVMQGIRLKFEQVLERAEPFSVELQAMQTQHVPKVRLVRIDIEPESNIRKAFNPFFFDSYANLSKKVSSFNSLVESQEGLQIDRNILLREYPDIVKEIRAMRDDAFLSEQSGVRFVARQNRLFEPELHLTLALREKK